MKRALARLRYFAGDAWDEWRRSPGVNLLAVSTLAAALFVAGLVLLVLHNVGELVGMLRDDLRVEVYLRDGADEAAIRRLRDTLAAVDGVQRVEFVDKDRALERFRASFGALADVAAELETNPLPASLVVFLPPGSGAVSVARGVSDVAAGSPAVDEVRFDRDWVDQLESLLRLARWGGFVLAVLVFSAVVFVMASVLRLAVYARRDEIEIMLLVGATPGFIRGPFLVSGVGQGVAAAAAAILLVEGTRRWIVARAGDGPAAVVDLVAGRPLPAASIALLAGVGLAVSLAGAFFAVRRSQI